MVEKTKKYRQISNISSKTPAGSLQLAPSLSVFGRRVNSRLPVAAEHLDFIVLKNPSNAELSGEQPFFGIDLANPRSAIKPIHPNL